jgi:crotonobetainyl-CoA:carnitine CoA-transferase CaiB-like acyl-CoA transferase
MDDPHLEAVGFFERYEHSEAGAYYGMKPPLNFSKTPANVRRHPPRLGEHTAELTD